MNARRRLARRPAIINGLGAVLLTLVLLLMPAVAAAQANGHLQIHYLNVGQGDAALIVSPLGQTMLIDSGPFSASNCASATGIVTQLTAIGVTKIDFHVASHYDADHIGCSDHVVAHFPVQQIAYDRGATNPPATATYTRYATAMASTRQTVTVGQQIALDAGSTAPVTFQVVAVNANGTAGSLDENDRSVVLVLHFGSFDAEFGGDLAGQTISGRHDIESVIATTVGQVEVYKVHHHGSTTSSNTTWMTTIHPKIAVLSVGSPNAFDHPTQAALDRIRPTGAITYWTTAGDGAPALSAFDTVVNGRITVDVPPAGTTFTVFHGSVFESYGSWGTSESPTITAQPQSQTIASGTAATMSVMASGTAPLSYRWYIGTSGTTTNPIGGATGSSYTTSTLTSTTSYWVRVSDSSGTADSSTALVTVGCSHLFDLNGDCGGDVFLYSKATGARRFELTERLTSGFTEVQGAWDPGWQIYPANLNADAYTDFYLYDPVRGFWIQALNHTGDGTFTYSLGNWDSSWTVVPSDLDGDGLTDMFVYNFNTGVWVKCFVDGSGGFKGCAMGNWDPGWTFHTADLNGDGRDDFFLYNRVNGVWVEAFSQSGFGTFDYPASGQWDPGWQVIPADLNGDGRTDLFLLNAAGVHVSTLSRTGGGFDYVGGPQWAAGWSVAPGDLNGDGATDLFLYNSTNGNWVAAFSSGAGSFTDASGTWDPGWTVALTDFNADSHDDLLLSRADGTWIQATNAGVGIFTYAVGNWGTGWTVFSRKLGDR